MRNLSCFLTYLIKQGVNKVSYQTLSLVYDPFEQSKIHSTLDFCLRPARKETNIPLHKRRAYCPNIYIPYTYWLLKKRKGKFFSEDITLPVRSPIFPNILLLLNIFQYIGTIKCLQKLAIWQASHTC